MIDYEKHFEKQNTYSNKTPSILLENAFLYF
jgi:hypothetical protein